MVILYYEILNKCDYIQHIFTGFGVSNMSAIADLPCFKGSGRSTACKDC